MGNQRKTDKGLKTGIVIDTDIFIDNLRGYEKAATFIKSVLKEEVYFSAITETELLAGKECADQSKKENVLHMLALFNEIVVDGRVAQLAGDIRRDYETTIPDAIIAATAIPTNSVLITRNTKDFEKINGLNSKSPY